MLSKFEATQLGQDHLAERHVTFESERNKEMIRNMQKLERRVYDTMRDDGTTASV
jgi:hypothetical protein